MLASKHRLPGPLIPQVLKNGRWISCSLFKTAVSKSKNQNHPKASVIVSKKYHRLAVRRNQVKRKLHQALQNIILKIDPSFQLVVMVKPAAKDASVDEFEKQLKKTLFEKQNV